MGWRRRRREGWTKSARAAIPLAALLAVALAACGGNTASGASGSGNTSTASGQTGSVPLRLGILSANIDPTLLTLLSGNYFKQVGLDVKVVRFDSGVPQVAAMTGGDIDVGYLAVSPLVSVAARGTPVKAVSIAYVGGTQALVVKPASGISTVTQLKGKSVGYVKGSIQEFAMQKILAQRGLGLSDVTSVNLPVALMASAYQRGSVNAEMAAQAALYKVLSEGAHILIRPEDVPGAGISGVTAYAANGNFIRQHPSEITKFVEAIELARKAVASNPSAAETLLENQAGVSSAEAAQIVKSVVAPSLAELTSSSFQYNLTAGGLAGQMQSVISFMAGKDEIPHSVSAASLVDGTPAQQASQAKNG